MQRAVAVAAALRPAGHVVKVVDPADVEGGVPTALDKAAFYGVQVNQDLFDPIKSRYVPAGSDSMMPVVKDPLMSGQGKTENVVRQVVVVPGRLVNIVTSS